MIRKGTYVLFLRFHSDTDVEVGSLGSIHLPNGDYCYVGSAMGGLDQRLSRHLAHDKKIRWHIDRLTVLCEDMFAYESILPIPECELADIVRSCGGVSAAKGFGCSDCDCHTHLFRIEPDAIMEALESRGLTKFVENQYNSNENRKN